MKMKRNKSVLRLLCSAAWQQHLREGPRVRVMSLRHFLLAALPKRRKSQEIEGKIHRSYLEVKIGMQMRR